MDASNIILGYRAPDIASPQEQQMKKLQLKNALQTNDLNQLKVNEARDAETQRSNLRTLLQNNPKATSQDILGIGDLDTAMKYGKYEDDRTKSASDATTAKLTQAKTKNGLIGQAMGYLKDNPSVENLQSTLSGLVTQGVMTPEEAQAAFEKGPKDPDGIRNLATQHFQSALDTDKQLGKIGDRNLGGNNQLYQANPVTGGVKVLDTAPVTLTPDQIADNTRSDDTAKETKRHNTVMEGQGIAKINQERSVDAANSGITPEAIDAAASRYRIDGTIPTLGMGKSAGAVRTQILNRAAEMDKADGIDGTGARVTQISGKASTASLAQLQKQKAMVSSFEKNAVANADLALKASSSVGRTGVPLFNSWMQAGRSGTGSVEANRFNAANETFVNEYAKVMSGSMGNTPVSDSARAHAHSILSTANTQQQYEGTINLLKQEMTNRMKGMDDEESDLRNSFGSKKQLRMPAASIPSGWSVKEH